MTVLVVRRQRQILRALWFPCHSIIAGKYSCTWGGVLFNVLYYSLSWGVQLVSLPLRHSGLFFDFHSILAGIRSLLCLSSYFFCDGDIWTRRLAGLVL